MLGNETFEDRLRENLTGKEWKDLLKKEKEVAKNPHSLRAIERLTDYIDFFPPDEVFNARILDDRVGAVQLCTIM